MPIVRLLLLSWVLLASCTYANSGAPDVVPPPKANVDKMLFENWQKQFLKVDGEVLSLLENAGISLKQYYLNSLVSEASPYLLRHSVNPINWQSWSVETKQVALAKNKLIFLSIGYSTCHWCHVMEKESFIDLDVAKALNPNFINIKVDRELTPELDAYMTDVLTLVKGSAGWPITAILTPNGDPIWIDSYIDKSQLLKVVSRFNTLWQTKPNRFIRVAANLKQQVHQQYQSASNEFSKKRLLENNQKLFSSLDKSVGGLSGKPKFPSESLLLFLLDSYADSPSEQHKEQLVTWLESLKNKGIRDHVHGGFHRYATDAIWQVPHYEKMLYNQALLIKVYAKASRILDNDQYLEVALDTLQFVERTMRANSGLYFSAIDADYNNQEGRYYLFSENEKAALPSHVQNAFAWYQFKDKPFFAPYIENASLQGSDARQTLIDIKQPLALPHIDEKAILSWNALMVDALIALYKATGNAKYLDSAIDTAVKLEVLFSNGNGLMARSVYLNKKGGVAAFEDYAYLSQVYLNFYKTTFDDSWLSKGKSTLRTIGRHFSEMPYRNIADGELLSPYALYYELLKDVAAIDPSFRKAFRNSRKQLQQAYSTQSSNAFSAAKVLSGLTEVSDYQVFAQGNGHIVLRKSGGRYSLDFQLKSGWHINSHQPNQKSLIATSLSHAGVQLLDVVYPKPVERKLGFDDKPLSLFEGNGEIHFTPKKSQRWLDVKVQACSDSVCLLPETLRFKL